MSNLVVTQNGNMVGGYAIEPSLGITTFNGKRKKIIELVVVYRQ